MIEVSAQSYIYALHTLMVCTIFAVVLVLSFLRKNILPSINFHFYLAYFVLGLIGWFVLALKQLGYIQLGVLPDYIFYVVCSFILYLAVTEPAWEWLRTRLLTFLHIAIIVGLIFLHGEKDQFLTLSVYAIAIYSVIAFSAFRRAVGVTNIGYAIIAVAALSVVITALYQCYVLLSHNDLVLAYNAAFIVSAVGFVLVSIGFLAVIIIHENHSLHVQAQNDPLTGLLNRRGLAYSLKVVISDAARNDKVISAMLIDIDHFKQINDLYGHEAGDRVLQSFGKALTNLCRTSDVLCRLGGEEFLVVMPSTSLESAITLAERLRAHIEILEISIADRIISITASFGVAMQQGEIELDGLIRDADKAVYEAKNAGRNQVCQA